MIADLRAWLGLDQPEHLNVIDLFLAGHSIPAISAPAGQDIIRRQREIEQELRDYILDLEREIADLRAELGQ